MKLLCKLVTKPLKPTACAHPIKLCNSLGSGLSDLHHCVGCGRGPWLESVINFPFLPVALSWKPSLFPLGDSDIGHNSAYVGYATAQRYTNDLSSYIIIICKTWGKSERPWGWESLTTAILANLPFPYSSELAYGENYLQCGDPMAL